VDPPPPGVAVGSAPWGPPGGTVDHVGADQAQLDALVGTWGGNLLDPDHTSAATYYPWVQIGGPWAALGSAWVPPSGSVAAVYATTDSVRGVWKAPAGVDAPLEGVSALADDTITDRAGEQLNVAGINSLRNLPTYGNVVWGARTLAGSDLTGSDFKYVPVRRLADFIEQSLLQSMAWTVFEPNGPSLWESISREAGLFLTGLFAQGAFQGTTPSQAYNVMCDATTTSAEDMLAGIVNLNVAFAPAEPAEFVVLNIKLGAGAPPASG
jgi:phage tail sheath protein FI